MTVNPDGTSAAAGQYAFNGAVTIPANSYFGSFTLTGIDDGLTTSGVTLSLQIDGIDDGGVGSPRTIDITIVEICPIDPSFATGDYTLNHLGGGIPAAGFAPAMGDGVTVTLVPGTASTERVFNVKFTQLFGFSNPPVDFSINLVCGETTVNGIINNGVSGNGWIFNTHGLYSNFGVYNTSDDSTMTVLFIEDVGGESCGTEAETTIRLTKQ